MKLIDLSLSMWMVGSLIVLLCSSPVQASLDGCTLYAGGDFSFSNSGLYSSLIGIDISTGSISPATGPGVYRDSFPDSLIYFADQLFFAGDLVRAKDLTTPAIARYDFDEDDYLTVSDGLELISKVFPTSDEDLSPSVLFRAWSDDVLLIGGHFDVSGDQTGFHNLAQYDPETDLLTNVAGRLPCSECSVISLTTSGAGDISVVTMDTSSYVTSVLTSNGVSGIWQSLSSAQLTDGTPVTLLFDNLVVGSDDAALFALGYVASTESLANKSIRFYLLRWDLTSTNSNPTYTLVWQKNCQSNEISKRSYPILKKIRDNLLVSVPLVSCATDTSAVSFLQFNPTNLAAVASTVSTLNSYNSVTNLQIAANGDVYVSNGINVSRFLYGGHSWTSLLDDDEDIRSMVFSDDSDDLYVGRVTSDHVFQVQYIPAGRSWNWDLFQDEIYAPGKIFTISQMLDGQFLVGGDFKYVGNSNGVGVTGAKVAAVWDGVSSWIPTLPSNADSYLTGWKLIASANVGSTVYGIVDAGPGVATLPLVRWNIEDGTWMYLYHRPTITTDIPYDSSVGSIYLDHKRNQIYFGGQFSVLYDETKPVAMGLIVYSIDREAWSSVPANFTKVTALGKLNGNAYLQIGGEFSYVDSRDYTHENYLVYDIEAADFVSAIPGFPSATIYSTALFPGQTESTFLAGEFGSSGVEQLRRASGSGTWAFAGVGNNPISPVVYSITSRNQGTVLFAGGSFPGALAMFDIARQQWSNMLTSPVYGNGLVYAVALTCPFDGENYSYETEVGYYADAGDVGCYIPVDALYDDCYVEPLGGWQIFGLCFTVVVTLVIIAVISFFIVKNLKQRAAAAPVDLFN